MAARKKTAKKSTKGSSRSLGRTAKKKSVGTGKRTVGAKKKVVRGTGRTAKKKSVGTGKRTVGAKKKTASRGRTSKRTTKKRR